MHEAKELQRHSSPAGRPAPIAFHDGTLWIGTWDTSQLIGIDPATWNVRETVDLPGKPFGLAALEGALHIVVSIGEDDDRFLMRHVPGGDLDESRTPCPELTGSHLAAHAGSLYLVQQHYGKIVQLDAAGAVQRSIALPSRCAGLAFKADDCFIISADADFDVLEFGMLDISADAGKFSPIAPMHVEARGLTYDGTHWWTNYRELNEVVSFDLAGAEAGA